jgi:hypothetical protein
MTSPLVIASGAKQSNLQKNKARKMDCFVVARLAMTGQSL